MFGKEELLATLTRSDLTGKQRSTELLKLLKSNPKLINVRFDKDKTLFHFLVLMGDHDCFERLFSESNSKWRRQFNALACLLDSDKKNILHYCLGQFPINYALLEMICKYFPMLVNHRDRFEQNALHYAVIASDVHAVCMLMQLDRVNVNAGDSFDQTPLHHAALRKNTEIVKLLRFSGKQALKSEDKWKKTALDYAVLAEDEAMAMQLDEITLIERPAHVFSDGNLCKQQLVVKNRRKKALSDVILLLDILSELMEGQGRQRPAERLQKIDELLTLMQKISVNPAENNHLKVKAFTRKLKTNPALLQEILSYSSLKLQSAYQASYQAGAATVKRMQKFVHERIGGDAQPPVENPLVMSPSEKEITVKDILTYMIASNEAPEKEQLKPLLIAYSFNDCFRAISDLFPTLSSSDKLLANYIFYTLVFIEIMEHHSSRRDSILNKISKMIDLNKSSVFLPGVDSKRDFNDKLEALEISAHEFHQSQLMKNYHYLRTVYSERLASEETPLNDFNALFDRALKFPGDKRCALVEAIAGEMRSQSLSFYQNMEKDTLYHFCFGRQKVEDSILKREAKRFNHLSNYLLEKVFEEAKDNGRKGLKNAVKLLLQVAKVLSPLNTSSPPDFNSLMLIRSVLADSSLSRLFSEINLNKGYTELDEYFEQITSHLQNYKAQREIYQRIPETIPYIGVYNSELIRIADAVSAHFPRLLIFAKVIAPLEQIQCATAFFFPLVTTNINQVSQNCPIMGDDEKYARSCCIKPAPGQSLPSEEKQSGLGWFFSKSSKKDKSDKPKAEDIRLSSLSSADS